MEIDGTRWFPATPPGWPSLLAVGTQLGVPWLVNPIRGGLNVLLAYLLLQGLYDRRVARIAVLLLCASPWFIFMAMNFMTHTSILTCALGAALAVARARATGKTAWGLAAGALVGIGSIIRPLDGLIVGLLVGLWALGLGGKRLRVTAIAALAAGTILTGALVLPYNRVLTGSATTFPLNAYVDGHFGPGRNDYGFGSNRGFGWPLDPNPGHDLVDALINANLNSFSLNTELFGWSTGSLLLAAVAVFAGPRRKSDTLMAAVIATVFVAYFPYYFSGGPDFGPRYWYLMIIPCVALTVRGMQALGTRIGGETGNTRVTVAVGMLCLMALINYIPWRAADKYTHFWSMRPDVRVLAEEYDFGRSLVLIRGKSHPDYTSAAVYNPLDLDADVPVYAWDADLRVRAQVVTAYRDRPVWIVNGPSITHGGFEVVKGPLAADQLLVEEEGEDNVSP
jgi:4-amino-4-deoxy-L-arabinose transferase-like glycosyltransferase